MAYLDHAATTPMLAEAVDAMSQVLSTPGNASALHASGRRARRQVEQARETIAGGVGARPSEVIFTAGGTESDNLAVKGIFWSRRQSDPRRNRILVSATEHHAVLDAVAWLAQHDGAEVRWLQVDERGRVTPAELRSALREAPEAAALVTVMWANNEIGTVNPIAELAAVAAEFDVPLHTDAVQALGGVEVDFAASGAAALTLTGHKLGGPMGAGVLLLGRDIDCTPLLHGGGQERDVRSGTLNLAAIVGLATAVRITTSQAFERATATAALRDQLASELLAVVPDARLNGDGLHARLGSGAGRLPGNAHFTFPGCEGDSLLMLLDASGIECSTGSACTAGVAQPSHVLLAMGVDATAARGSLRFSLGHNSTEEDVAALIHVIGPAVARARNAARAAMRLSDRAAGVQV
ncbi:MAG: cysteine desulfurase family protein [Sciscionella sp.]